MEYLIGDFSKISRVSIKTLRYYHDIGLICPSRINSETGYRFYDENCLNRIWHINVLKELNFSLKDIMEILDKYEEDEDLATILKQKLNETKEKINEFKQIQSKLETIITNQTYVQMDENTDIVVKNVPDILIASIRTKDTYNNMGTYMEKILKQYTRYICGKPFTLYYDSGYKEKDVDMEICFPVSRVLNNKTIAAKMHEGGQVLSVLHKGEYSDIGRSYKVLLDYISKNEIAMDLPTREIYIKGPGMIFAGNPKKYITELQIMMK